jgi:hypothetical protein
VPDEFEYPSLAWMRYQVPEAKMCFPSRIMTVAPAPSVTRTLVSVEGDGYTEMLRVTVASPGTTVVAIGVDDGVGDGDSVGLAAGVVAVGETLPGGAAGVAGGADGCGVDVPVGADVVVRCDACGGLPVESPSVGRGTVGEAQAVTQTAASASSFPKRGTDRSSSLWQARV